MDFLGETNPSTYKYISVTWLVCIRSLSNLKKKKCDHVANTESSGTAF